MLGFATRGLAQCGSRGDPYNLLLIELSKIWRRCLNGLNGGRFFEGDRPKYKERHARKTIHFFKEIQKIITTGRKTFLFGMGIFQGYGKPQNVQSLIAYKLVLPFKMTN